MYFGIFLYVLHGLCLINLIGAMPLDLEDTRVAADVQTIFGALSADETLKLWDLYQTQVNYGAPGNSRPKLTPIRKTGVRTKRVAGIGPKQEMMSRITVYAFGNPSLPTNPRSSGKTKTKVPKSPSKR